MKIFFSEEGILISASERLRRLMNKINQVTVGCLLFSICCILFSDFTYAQNVVELQASKDNTLYSESNLSNGQGDYFFVGRTSQVSSSLEIRRGLIAFDIAAAIPQGSTIESVTLTLSLSRRKGTLPLDVSLHPALADWGEGSSHAAGEEGSGAQAETGDATWFYAFFNTISWSNTGGDFDPASSAATTVSNTGFYSWSSASMVEDVQNWIDNPGSNFGWVIIGNENSAGTAMRFVSSENSVGNLRPFLVIEYSPPSNLDTDGDGMLDVWEIQYGLNPLINDSGDDADGDRFSNLTEYNRGTDPTDSQSHPPRAMPWIPLLLEEG